MTNIDTKNDKNALTLVSSRIFVKKRGRIDITTPPVNTEAIESSTPDLYLGPNSLVNIYMQTAADTPNNDDEATASPGF